jgi:predicted MPP superfamily phosphohydrolase
MNAIEKGLMGGGVAAVALAAYSLFVEPRWLELTRTRIHLKGLHPDLEGLRIALLTDLHAGEATSMSIIRRACRLTMAERPHFIAVTGDLIADGARGFDRVLDEISCLAAPLGVYAVPGNHDHIVGIGRWHRDVGDHPGITDLTNAHAIRELGAARLCIAGVDDLTCGDPSLHSLPAPAERDVTVLLAHDPDQAEQARRAYDDIDLVLSGHTHGGQVRLPLVGAIRNPAWRDELYDEGLRRRPWTQVYVSRGIGTVHLPIRFMCRPEVAILELTGARRPSK